MCTRVLLQQASTSPRWFVSTRTAEWLLFKMDHFHNNITTRDTDTKPDDRNSCCYDCLLSSRKNSLTPSCNLQYTSAVVLEPTALMTIRVSEYGEIPLMQQLAWWRLYRVVGSSLLKSEFKWYERWHHFTGIYWSKVSGPLLFLLLMLTRNNKPKQTLIRHKIIPAPPPLI